MSTKDGGPAFPSDEMNGVHPGMSLRAWFAGQALVGLVTHTGSYGIGHSPEELAKRSVEIGDAMITALKAERSP